jgi:C4-dicarboxylate-binding protein DctP
VIDKWAAEVEQLSDGEIDVQVFPANSLVSDKESIPAVAKGDIECAFALNFAWGRTLPAMLVTTAPFTFGNMDVWKKWPGSDAAHFLEDKLLEKGLKNVTWLFQTNTSVFTSNGKFLKSPADFEGIKIRGLVPPFNAGLEKMGASPVSMSGGEVYQALSTGVIDAALTDIAAAVSRKYYEVQDHMTVVPVISVYAHGFVNPKWYSGLSEKSQSALNQAGEMAALQAIDVSAEAIAEAPAQLEAQGVRLHQITAEEQQALADVMLPAFNKAFGKWAGEDSEQLIKLVQELQ